MQCRKQFNGGKQKGVVLFITMIALVVLLLAAVALIRSTDTSVALSGNIAVKRDMTNQAEQAIATATGLFGGSGALAAQSARTANIATANYSSTMLASTSNTQGIPDILFDTASNYSSRFSGAGLTTNNGITYRYVIDRLCSKTGAPDPRYCTTSSSTAGERSGTDWLPKPDVKGSGYVYRITVRVTDVKQAQSFIQTTITI